MSHKHTIALIGCGRVAQHYVRILRQLDPCEGLEVVACCDLDDKKAVDVASAFGARHYTDVATMLTEEKPEIAAILTFSGLHYRHAKQALEAGCHVLVEKPITLIPDQARQLSKLAREKRRYCGVAFQNRYNPSIMKLREAMDEGRFGKIITSTIRLRWCRYQDYYMDGWHGTWARDGGVINQQAIHHVDALNWICGPIHSVCALMENRLNSLEAEDTMVAAVRFVNGALGTIEATTAARPEDFEASLSVVGEKGMVQIGGIALNKIDVWRFVEPRDGDDQVPVRFSQDVPTGYGLSHGPLFKDWCAHLDRGDSESPIPALDGLGAVELVHALYASIESGGWVNLADKPLSRRLGV